MDGSSTPRTPLDSPESRLLFDLMALGILMTERTSAEERLGAELDGALLAALRLALRPLATEPAAPEQASDVA
jgi:hypothetical protein